MLTTLAIKRTPPSYGWSSAHEYAHGMLDWWMRGGEEQEILVDLDSGDLVFEDVGTSFAVQCKSGWLAQLHLLDHTIDSLTIDASDSELAFAVPLTESWIQAYEAKLAETKEQLSRSERRKLVDYLKKIRQLLLEACQSVKCEFFRHLDFLQFKKLKAWLMSFRYAMQRLHCSAESFNTGGVSELQRSRHFLTVTDRYVSQLWSRVIAAVGYPFSGLAIARRRLVAAPSWG